MTDKQLDRILTELQALRGEVEHIRQKQEQHMADTAHYLSVIIKYVSQLQPHVN